MGPRLAALVLLLLAAGCGSVARVAKQAPGQGATPAHTVVPSGFRRHAIREAGFSVALPIGWQTLAQRDAVSPGIMQILTKLDPGFRIPLLELASPDSPLKLFAFDRRFWRGHSTTIVVMRVSYERPGAYDRWSGRAIRILRGAGRHFRSARVDLPAGAALRVTYERRAGDTVIDYVVADRDGLWAIALTTPTPLALRYAPALARAAATLELRTPLGGPTRIQAPAPPA